MKKLLFLCTALFVFCSSYAQSDFVANGGEAHGNGGSVSYSVGQIAIQNNGNGSTSINEGVQQPYEISVIGIDNYRNISLNAFVHPNPTQGNLQLTIQDFQMENGELQVYDINGKYLLTQKIEGENTRFDLSEYAAGTYFVNVMNGKSLLKSFKVVKMGN